MTGNGERPSVRYSPDRRTALVFCGTGAHGAYHAGVLKALQEAGVKVDVMAGHGIGAAAAALAAIDGAARLWTEKGIWADGAAWSLYRMKRPVRAAGLLAAVLAAAVLTTLLLAVANREGVLLRSLAVVSLLLAGLALALVASAGLAARRAPVRRFARGRPWWRAMGAPLEAEEARS